jgi:hypothetical protein
LQSVIGLSDGREISCPNRFAVRVSRRIFTAAITDKAVAERMTQKMNMEWVIVRPVVLVDGTPAMSSLSFDKTLSAPKIARFPSR